MYPMSDSFTLRLQAVTLDRLRTRAKRLGTPPRTLAQRYVDEGLRQDQHPLVHFVDGVSGRRAALVGSGLDVWEVIATVRDNNNDLEEAAQYLGVSLGLVQAAVAYYGEYRAEIDSEMADNDIAWKHGYEAVEAGRRALET
jgi:uncharacterized protein (DUF433 family)